MSLHTQHKENSEVYFCTVTCYKWLPLFEEAQTYYSVYRWFDHLDVYYHLFTTIKIKDLGEVGISSHVLLSGDKNDF